MDNNILLAYGGFIIAIITLIGSIVMRDRALNKSIVDGDIAVRKDTETLVKDEVKGLEATIRDLNLRITSLDDRINNVNDRFVRRDDLSAHIDRIEGLIKDQAVEQRETNKRIDVMLGALVNKGVALTP